MVRDEFIAQTIDRSHIGLEVGPGYAPTFPKSQGWNVDTLDHASADDLRRKYEGMIDTSRIEEIEYISDGKPLHEIIGLRNHYDFIYASHVIEHVTDPIAFFKSCEMLLKENGRLVLVVPDKRKCFDAFQSVSTTGDFLDAYHLKATRHAPGRAFDFIANTTSLDQHGIWERDWTGAFSLTNTIEQAAEIWARASSPGDYIDIHAWRFTPTSLRLIMSDLYAMNMINLRENVFGPSHTMEFYFSCTKNSDGPNINRLDLLRDLAEEQIDGYQHIIEQF